LYLLIASTVAAAAAWSSLMPAAFTNAPENLVGGGSRYCRDLPNDPCPSATGCGKKRHNCDMNGQAPQSGQCLPIAGSSACAPDSVPGNNGCFTVSRKSCQ
jgi:hypothetical protein